MDRDTGYVMNRACQGRFSAVSVWNLSWSTHKGHEQRQVLNYFGGPDCGRLVGDRAGKPVQTTAQKAPICEVRSGESESRPNVDRTQRGSIADIADRRLELRIQKKNPAKDPERMITEKRDADSAAKQAVELKTPVLAALVDS